MEEPSLFISVLGTRGVHVTIHKVTLIQWAWCPFSWGLRQQQARRWHVFWLAWAESTCLQPDIFFKRENILHFSMGLTVLTARWVRVPAWLLLNLFSQSTQFSEKILASLRWGLEMINKNSSLKCRYPHPSERCSGEKEELLAVESFGQQGEFLSAITLSSRCK